MTPLSVIVKIKSGEEAALRQILKEINDDLQSNRYVRFPESRVTHLARFVIIEDPENGPRLLFASNYDGDLQSYLDELISISPGLEELWGKCEGYPGKAQSAHFLRQHSYVNRGVYVGFPDETLESIRNKVAVRQQLEQFLDTKKVAAFLEQSTDTFLERLAQLATKPPWWIVLGTWLWSTWSTIWTGIHDVLLRLLLRLAEWYSQLGMAREFSRVTSSCDMQPGHQIAEYYKSRTDELTSFTVFANVKPGFLPLLNLWIALAGTRLLAKYGYRPYGNFANVYTLHEFRWLLLDKGKRLIFMSTFDGSWENYMGDFVDNLVWALNALYKNTEGYPPAGMQEVEVFKQWILDHQPQPLVVYNTYNETVLQLMRDRQITSALAAQFNREAIQQWLALL